jgi:hypothetical protein
MSSDEAGRKKGGGKPKRPPGFFLRLPRNYRRALEACRKKNKRTVIGETECALEAWFKLQGVPFDPDDVADDEAG